MAREDVARLAGVPASEVHSATADEVRAAYADSAASVVVEVATQQPALYWRADSKFFLDDPYFSSEPVAIDDLDYNSDIGLHRRKEAN